MFLRGGSGKIYNINTTPFANGGEGSIHTIPGSNLVAKIYNKNERTSWKHEKIEGMVKLSSSFRNSSIAWPLESLFDSGGFVGFVMRKFDNTKMLSVAFTKKAFTFKDKLAIAISLCERVSEIHANKQCIGDLSDNNIGIKDKTVYLFDADSFQFSDYTTKTKYRCCVFTDGFVAPEILTKMNSCGNIKAMKISPYNVESDLFVLAIHVFKLLCGSHPFACAVDSNITSTPSLNENIQNGYSPFFAKKTGYNIPAYAADPHFLPKEVQYLFYKAFISGHKNPMLRPSANEWILALRNLNAQPTKKCKQNATHIFLKENKSCPFCEANERINSIAHHSVRQPQPTTTTLANNSPKTVPSKTKVKHTTAFWVATLSISIIAQAIIAYLMYFSPSFCNANPSDMDIVMQVVIFVAGIIGPIIYNVNSNKETFMSYVSSIMISPLSSVAVVAAILLLGVSLGLIIAFGAVAMIVGILSDL